MNDEIFFKDNRLPFAECRYSKSSRRSFKPHLHRTFSIGAVDCGQALYRVGDRSILLSTGSLALINPETLHFCNAAASEGRSYYMLYLDVEWCRTLQKSLWRVDTFIPVTLAKLDDLRLYRLFCRVMRRLMDPAIHLLEKEQLLIELTGRIFKKACGPQTGQRLVEENIHRLKQALAADLREDLTLEALARDMDANPYTLLRRFKAATGITPHAYRMNCRIEQARLLLQQGLDIADTALECGFFDQSHLHRHFKAMTTVTPQEYRVNFIQ
jgi:AraC-like DNA-binding protein